LIRSRVGHAWPTNFILDGLLKEDDFKIVVHEIKKILDQNTEDALKNETAIIHKARELGLNPRPAGIHQNNWYATCPGTSHALYITAVENEFGCSYLGKTVSMRLGQHRPAGIF